MIIGELLLDTDGTHLCIRHEEGQAKAAEARLDDERVVVELLLDLGVAPVGHRQQSDAVRSCALAPSSGLDAKQVVQESAH